MAKYLPVLARRFQSKTGQRDQLQEASNHTGPLIKPSLRSSRAPGWLDPGRWLPRFLYFRNPNPASRNPWKLWKLWINRMGIKVYQGLDKISVFYFLVGGGCKNGRSPSGLPSMPTKKGALQNDNQLEL